MSLLRVENLNKCFTSRHGLRRERLTHHAVKDLSLTLEAGETLAVVGESGAGKSTTGRLILRLIEPDSGTVELDGVDVRALERGQLRSFRRNAQMIFQDPHSSFDPRLTILDSVAEPMHVHGIGSKSTQHSSAGDLLERVGLGPHLFERFPSQLSGGQLQRAAIARALTTDPKLIVCDEPVSALDVSIRAQVINLLQDLQGERDIAYLFITHDLALVETFADQTLVMRMGEVVEHRPTEDLFHEPNEAYTRELLDAIPEITRLSA